LPFQTLLLSLLSLFNVRSSPYGYILSNLSFLWFYSITILYFRFLKNDSSLRIKYYNLFRWSLFSSLLFSLFSFYFSITRELVFVCRIVLLFFFPVFLEIIEQIKLVLYEVRGSFSQLERRLKLLIFFIYISNLLFIINFINVMLNTNRLFKIGK
jgi:hypothetical protein